MLISLKTTYKVKNTSFERFGVGIELVNLYFMENFDCQEGYSQDEFELIRREAHDEADSNDMVAHAQQVLLLPILHTKRKTLYSNCSCYMRELLLYLSSSFRSLTVLLRKKEVKL